MPKSSSEIVDAHLLQLVEPVARELGVVEEDGFGDLDLEPARRQVGGGKRLADDVGDVAAPELDRRHVDGDAHVVGPFRALQAGFAQDEVADLDDQPHLLGHRNELRRRDHAAHRMRPAQQGLAGRDALGVHVQQGLVVDLEGVGGQRIAQVQLQVAARLRHHVHALLEEAPGPAAVRLGAIEGHVGVLEQADRRCCRRAAPARCRCWRRPPPRGR